LVYYLCNIASIPAAVDGKDTCGVNPGGRPNPGDGAGVPGGGPKGPAALNAAAIASAGDRNLGSSPAEGLIPENCDYIISHTTF